MVEIGGFPILWHILKTYSAHNINDFIVCCGYRGYVIKDWFASYAMRTSDVTFDFTTGEVEIHAKNAEAWRVTLVDTGDATMTGGRLRRVAEHVGDEAFCFTYGDGVSNVDVTALVDFHRREGRLATLTAVQPPGRFGALQLADGQTGIDAFSEKPGGDGAWVNGGYFVLDPSVVEYIKDDDTVWEQEPLRRLAQDQQLSAFRHTGFWQPMDTLHDRTVLEQLWQSGRAPWKVW